MTDGQFCVDFLSHFFCQTVVLYECVLQFCTKSSHRYLAGWELLCCVFSVSITAIIVPGKTRLYLCGQSTLTFTVQFLSNYFQEARSVLEHVFAVHCVGFLFNLQPSLFFFLPN